MFFYAYIFIAQYSGRGTAMCQTKIIHNSLDILLSLDLTFCLKLDFLKWA